ncbi:MAG: prepilin-type N-terminal cleavage/methylation domain-containing protein [Akkermansiaceae bacterium]|jgi:prepilin-type N-terminal cleavage/methylation domain-containing protein/prepilin-type processing-associated H-X9-DG protein|nr:prepilin-type N-terminal cleavage/methylation domain-containing protein [Akkermansiaceae bacterium]
MMRNGHRRRIHGFSLIELLVVLCLIACLSGIGFQGYRVARLRANQTVSAAHLSQLVTANLLYAADQQTYCPADLDGRNLIRWHGRRTSTRSKFDPEKGLLAEYLGLSRRVGICPELQRLITASAFNESGSGGYGYNDTFIGGLPSEANKPNRPAAVRDPSRTLMFATTAFAVAGGLQEYPSASPPFWVDSNWKPRGKLQPSIHFRFNGKALVAWCDGHVTEEIRSESSSTNFYGGSNASAQIGFCGPSENNGWWNPRN